LSKITPKDLGLPYADWYPYQLETAKAVAETEEPVTLCEAPTGSGKSGVAIAAARLLRRQRSVVLCSTKQLQLQYQNSFPDIAVLWGRNNFQCALDPDLTCDEAPCSLEGFGCDEREKWEVCPYYRAKKKALASPIVVTNTSYFLCEANYVGRFSGLNFLVVDEGDLLERELLRFASIELSRRSFALSEIDLPNLKSVYEARRWARKALPKVTRQAEKARELAGSDSSWLKAAVRLKGQAKRLAKLSGIDPEKWVLQKTLFGYSIQPLWANSFGQDYVFRHADKVLIMSATMPPPGVYARQLGITQPVQYIEIPSFFPKENRPVNVWPIVKLKGAELRDYELNLVVNAVDLILQRFPNVKGLVHTVSYRLRDAILERTRFRERFISHNLGDEYVDRSEALERFIESPEPKVLISPSMGRGVDLHDDLARFVIIVKLPFLDLSDLQVRTRMERDPEWYTAVTADEIVQACGRAVRHKDDFAVSFILDGQAEWFLPRNKSFFPAWWREAVYKIESLEEAVLPPQMVN